MVGLRIAVRYLFAGNSHKAVNIISRISVAGVAIATAAIICVLSVFNGFTKISEERLSKLDPDIRIEPAKGKVIEDADSLAKLLMTIAGVRSAMPVLEERVLAIYGGRQLPVNVKGVGKGYEDESGIEDIIIDGKYEGEFGVDYESAMLSVGTAINLAAHPGYFDYLVLYAPKRVGRINPALAATSFRSDTFLVGGVYETGQTEYDTDKIIVPIGNVRELLDYTSEGSSIEVMADEGSNIGNIIKEIRAVTGANYVVKDRVMQQDQSYKMISVEKWITFALLAFVLLIASFNVISTMSMIIIEKKDNIGTLRSLGARNSMIGSVFGWEGWLISMTGGVSGTVLGLILCYCQQIGGFIKLNGDPSQLSVTVYPVFVEWGDIGMVLVLVGVVGAVISYVSGRFAMRF